MHRSMGGGQLRCDVRCEGRDHGLGGLRCLAAHHTVCVYVCLCDSIAVIAVIAVLAMLAMLAVIAVIAVLEVIAVLRGANDAKWSSITRAVVAGCLLGQVEMNECQHLLLR